MGRVSRAPSGAQCGNHRIPGAMPPANVLHPSGMGMGVGSWELSRCLSAIRLTAEFEPRRQASLAIQFSIRSPTSRDEAMPLRVVRLLHWQILQKRCPMIAVHGHLRSVGEGPKLEIRVDDIWHHEILILHRGCCRIPAMDKPQSNRCARSSTRPGWRMLSGSCAWCHFQWNDISTF